MRWHPAEDEVLFWMAGRERRVAFIAQHLERTRGSVKARLNALELPLGPKGRNTRLDARPLNAYERLALRRACGGGR